MRLYSKICIYIFFFLPEQHGLNLFLLCSFHFSPISSYFISLYPYHSLMSNRIVCAGGGACCRGLMYSFVTQSICLFLHLYFYSFHSHSFLFLLQTLIKNNCINLSSSLPVPTFTLYTVLLLW